jgi:invasion protein IalB
MQEEHSHGGGSVNLPEPKRTPGSQKWCKRCSRRHGTREACQMIQQPRIAKSEKLTLRWVATPQEKN